MKKRVLSALLVLCMACSMVSTVWANDDAAAVPTPSPTAETTLVEMDSATPEVEDDAGAPAGDEDANSGAAADDTAASQTTGGAEEADVDQPESTETQDDTDSDQVMVGNGESGVEQPVSIEDDTVSEPVQDSIVTYQVNAPQPRATVAVEDQIKSTGRLVATVSGAGEGELTYTWYRSADGAAAVEVQPVKVTGDDYNAQDNWLNVALDIESLCEGKTTAEKNTIRSQTYTYYVVVKQGETEVAQSDAYQVPYYAQLLNGDFEAGDAHWATTASTDTTIEIGSYSQEMYVYGTTNDLPVTGGDTNFAELNAHEAASLYQDVLTVPGTELTWQLAHRARNAKAQDWERDNFIEDATDTMYVVIMSESDAEALLADAAARRMTQQQLLTDMIEHAFDTGSVASDGNMTNAQYTLSDGKPVAVAVKEVTTTSHITLGEGVWVRDGFLRGHYEYPNASSSGQWGVYGDSYKVPEGQYATRFFFVAGDTQTNDVTVGNLIDDVWFSPELPPANPDQVTITGTKTVTIDKLPSGYSVTINLSGLSGSNNYTASQTIQLTNNGNGTYSGTYAFTNISIAANSTPTFTVTEAVTGEPSTELYEISNGGTVTSTNGTTETFTGMTTSVNVSRGNTYTVDFNNTYIPKTTDLTITKTFVGLDEAKANQVWNALGFTVASNGSTLAPAIDKEDEVTASGNTFTATATIKGLTIGQAYTITETGAELDGYTLSTVAEVDEEGDTATAEIEALAQGTSVSFTNTYTRDTGTLTIQKQVTGLLDSDSAADETFTVTITGPADAADVTFKDANNSDKKFVLAADGSKAEVANVAVQVGTNLVINNLPTDEYTVQETLPTGNTDILNGKYYFVNAQNGGKANVILDKNGKTATITNNYAPYYSVTIEKQVGGEMGSGEDWFDFTVSPKENGSLPEGMTITSTDSEVNRRIDMDDHTFQLKAGATVTIGHLKANDAIVVIEAASQSGYKTTINASGCTNASISDGGANGVVTIEVPSTGANSANLGKVVYTNTRTAVAPTGLESNHTTPYVLMITAAGMAGLALIGGIVARRIRRRRED